MKNISSLLEKILPAVISIAPKKSKKKNEGGSGFIIDKNGLILTNRHLVSKNKKYLAIISEKEKYEAEILSSNFQNDVAILKISSSKKFPFLPLGDSSKIKIGERVFAVGNAMGFEDTVSQGIISGLNRTIGTLKGLIQTDAAINPGNSGGPLINEKGKVIGINSIIMAQMENIGFAIPINEAKKDLKTVKKYGKTRYPFLGFNYLDQKEGALVIEVGKNLKNKLRKNDLILECNGKKITQDFQLEDCLKKLKVGQIAKFKIQRGKEKLEIKIPVKEKS